MAEQEARKGPARGAYGSSARGQGTAPEAGRSPKRERAENPAARAEQQSAPPIGGVVRIRMLKRRSEFLRVRKGARWTVPAFVLEANVRDAAAGPPAAEGARFGFTVTRQVGNAVERNRIRRRLKAAIARAAPHARGDCDYVLVARRAALLQPFAALLADAVAALDRIHRRPLERRRHKETGNKLAG